MESDSKCTPIFRDGYDCDLLTGQHKFIVAMVHTNNFLERNEIFSTPILCRPTSDETFEEGRIFKHLREERKVLARHDDAPEDLIDRRWRMREEEDLDRYDDACSSREIGMMLQFKDDAARSGEAAAQRRFDRRAEGLSDSCDSDC